MTFGKASIKTTALWGQRLAWCILAVDVMRVVVGALALVTGLIHGTGPTDTSRNVNIIVGFTPPWLAFIVLSILTPALLLVLATVELVLYKKGSLHPVFVIVMAFFMLCLWAATATIEMLTGNRGNWEWDGRPPSAVGAEVPAWQIGGNGVWVVRIAASVLGIAVEIACIVVASCGVHHAKRSAQKANVFFIEPSSPLEEGAPREERVSPLPGYMSPGSARSGSVRSAEYFDEKEDLDVDEKDASGKDRKSIASVRAEKF